MKTQNQQAVTFDKYGRMQYHPDYHAKHGQPWTTKDEQFLIENYVKIGPEETSFALERTIHTVMTKAAALRKADRMPQAGKVVKHKRMQQMQ
jgi:hypothetical protein